MLVDCRQTLEVRERQMQHKVELTNAAINCLSGQADKIDRLGKEMQAALNETRAIQEKMASDWLECYRDLATVPVDWRGGAFSVPKIERHKSGISFVVSRTEIN